MEIFDAYNVIFTLLQRIDELKELANLEVLHLCLQPSNLEYSARLREFLVNFPKLQRIEFSYSSDFNDEAKSEFQGLEHLWIVDEFERIESHLWKVQYVRKGAPEKYRGQNYVIAPIKL